MTKKAGPREGERCFHGDEKFWVCNRSKSKPQLFTAEESDSKGKEKKMSWILDWVKNISWARSPKEFGKGNPNGLCSRVNKSSLAQLFTLSNQYKPKQHSRVIPTLDRLKLP